MATHRAAAFLGVALFALASCADGRGDLGFGVTERDGIPELVIAVCAQPPPVSLIVARGPTGGTPPWAEEPREEYTITRVARSDWESDQLVISLDTHDAPASMRGIWVVYDYGPNPTRGAFAGSALMPEPPWPSHPSALATASLTEPFGERPVDLDAEPGDICEDS